MVCRTILIVDDGANIRTSLRVCLERDGYTVALRERQDLMRTIRSNRGIGSQNICKRAIPALFFASKLSMVEFGS
jgi:DNA-binding NtrC family response regulator